MHSIEELNYHLQFLKHLVQEVHIFASMKPFLSVHSNGIIKTLSHYQKQSRNTIVKVAGSYYLA